MTLRWIPVTEDVPLDSRKVLVAYEDGAVMVGWYSDFMDLWFSHPLRLDAPVAWMPIPQFRMEVMK